jgi:hypothetical protein
MEMIPKDLRMNKKNSKTQREKKSSKWKLI